MSYQVTHECGNCHEHQDQTCQRVWYSAGGIQNGVSYSTRCWVVGGRIKLAHAVLASQEGRGWRCVGSDPTGLTNRESASQRHSRP